jgi:eukaryotic-like serine/threonine-protein kinase
MSHLTEQLNRALAGRYTIQRELGRGGMATVYLVEDLKHHRQVALKLLRPELAEAVGSERFLREIEIAARLHHPHILALYDSGEADGLLYSVMPYAEGESLRDRLSREKQLPVADALRIAHEVADALSYAHSRGVVHRDIKPENILLESGHAVVADFGIARAIHAAGGDQLTATGLAIGTPAYMSPEQAGGSSEIDGRSDMYSLGCVLYEMLAGQPPFTGPTVESLVHQHLASLAPNVTSIRPTVPVWVAAALERALAKTPADRFSAVSLFAEALTPRESAAVVPAATRAVSPSRRLRHLAVAGVAVLVVFAGALMALRSGDQPPVVSGYPRTAVAVLPFQNLSIDPAEAYFAGGLHDELLTQLSKVAALSLRGRTSVMGYASTTKSIRQIAEELEVGVLVEGTVQVLGGRLRVNMQLIDAATDEHLWAESYDRTLDDAFAIQSDVAQQVVAAVGATLTGGTRLALGEAPTTNAEAYRLYLQGRDYGRRPGRLRQNLESAQQLYMQALLLDPDFALAYAALSEVHGFMHWFAYDVSTARIALQRETAETALRLAPELPQAHVAMGLWHYWGQRDYTRAVESFNVALRGLPNDAFLWSFVGYVHRRLGNWSEVDAAYERAVELDPRDADLFLDLGGVTFQHTRRYVRAVQAYDRALSLAPDLHAATVRKAWTYVVWQGRLDSLRLALQGSRDIDFGFLGDAASQRARLHLLERNSDSLMRVLADGQRGVFEAQDFFVPASLYAAWAHQLRGEAAMARAAFEAARLFLDSVVAERPNDWRVRAARGLAYSGLGNRAAALGEAGLIQGSIVYREDAFSGTWAAEDRARILAQSGEAEAALDEIERLLARPSYVSVHTLRLDPRWDPIRQHPRFRALMAKYAQR